MMKILAYIPARSGSTRIKNKNIKNFLGKPLIAYTIEQALACDFIDRIIVDTDSLKIAKIAEKYGAQVPFLRPKRLATAKTPVMENIKYTLDKLKKDEGYFPDYLLILQTTSPLREKKDIQDCLKLMKKGGATSVVTVAPTHPRLYHLTKDKLIKLANKQDNQSSNVQDWENGYLLNGAFAYLIKVSNLLKENTVITKKTKAVICPKWRSVDIDTPEEWVMAEVLYKNKDYINGKLERF